MEKLGSSVRIFIHATACTNVRIIVNCTAMQNLYFIFFNALFDSESILMMPLDEKVKYKRLVRLI